MNEHNVEPYIHYFTGSWCAPCQALKPSIDNIVNQYDVRLNTYDAETNELIQEAEDLYGVTVFPTVLMGFYSATWASDGEPRGIYPVSWFIESPSATDIRNAMIDANNIIQQTGGNFDQIISIYDGTANEPPMSDPPVFDDDDDGDSGGGLLGIFDGSFNLFGFDVPNWLGLLLGAAAVKRATRKDDE